jgi:hypothetical protein
VDVFVSAIFIRVRHVGHVSAVLLNDRRALDVQAWKLGHNFRRRSQ